MPRLIGLRRTGNGLGVGRSARQRRRATGIQPGLPKRAPLRPSVLALYARRPANAGPGAHPRRQARAHRGPAALRPRSPLNQLGLARLSPSAQANALAESIRGRQPTRGLAPGRGDRQRKASPTRRPIEWVRLAACEEANGRAALARKLARIPKARRKKRPRTKATGVLGYNPRLNACLAPRPPRCCPRRAAAFLSLRPCAYAPPLPAPRFARGALARRANDSSAKGFRCRLQSNRQDRISKNTDP